MSVIIYVAADFEGLSMSQFIFPLISSYGSRSPGTVCESNFWLELNYLEVAKAAQSCSAHFTALLYTEIYVDKLKANMEGHYR